MTRTAPIRVSENLFTRTLIYLMVLLFMLLRTNKLAMEYLSPFRLHSIMLINMLVICLSLKHQTDNSQLRREKSVITIQSSPLLEPYWISCFDHICFLHLANNMSCESIANVNNRIVVTSRHPKVR